MENAGTLSSSSRSVISFYSVTQCQVRSLLVKDGPSFQNLQYSRKGDFPFNDLIFSRNLLSPSDADLERRSPSRALFGRTKKESSTQPPPTTVNTSNDKKDAARPAWKIWSQMNLWTMYKSLLIYVVYFIPFSPHSLFDSVDWTRWKDLRQRLILAYLVWCDESCSK